MSINQIVEKENVKPSPAVGDYDIKKEAKPLIYSDKLKEYIPMDASDSTGDIQKYNVGLGPGSWY